MESLDEQKTPEDPQSIEVQMPPMAELIEERRKHREKRFYYTAMGQRRTVPNAGFQIVLAAGEPDSTGQISAEPPHSIERKTLDANQEAGPASEPIDERRKHREKRFYYTAMGQRRTVPNAGFQIVLAAGEPDSTGQICADPPQYVENETLDANQEVGPASEPIDECRIHREQRYFHPAMGQRRIVPEAGFQIVLAAEDRCYNQDNDLGERK